MSSVGELFIQLGVLGNANELKKANQEFQKANALTEKQNKLDKLRAETLERIQKAETKAEKRRIVEQYRARKINIQKQSALKMQILEKKGIQGNIAQWASYAHMVSMASSIAISAIKKINDEVNKLMTTNQQMYNAYNMTSSPLSAIMGYSTAGSIFNPNLSKEQIANSLVGLDAKFNMARRTGDYGSIVDINKASLLGNGANNLISQVYGGRYKEFSSYLEAVRGLLLGASPEEQVNIAEAFLGDTSLLPMLRKSKQEYDELIAKANKYKLTQSEIEGLEQARVEIAIVQNQLQDIYSRLVLKAVPYVEKAYSYISLLAQKELPQIETIFTNIKEIFNSINTEEFKRAFETVLKITLKITELLTGLINFWIKEWTFVFNSIAKIINFIKPGAINMEDIHRKATEGFKNSHISSLNQSKIDNKSVVFNGDINVSTPQTGSQFANDFMCNLTEQRNFSY